ncbi:MAG: DUF3849 domain-containing protein [Clostridia bacterium]|nr:DUF3849 domain-containing protein [Clostridia bacterium]
MSEHEDLYPYSQGEAVRLSELALWRESYKANCDCARAIERAIRDNYQDNRLHACMQPLIKEYGFNRVNWVLANTVCQNPNDGRFSESNRLWARSFHIASDEPNWQFSVSSHPGLVNIAIDEARRIWKSLGLFDGSHCISEKDGQIDYRGKVVVIDPNIFKDEYKTPDHQLFLAESGFGCSPNSRGRKVYGTFLKDGIETYYTRSEILGILKDEYLPEWARDILTEPTPHDEGEDEGKGMTMT